jgi:hypothetical protein
MRVMKNLLDFRAFGFQNAGKALCVPDSYGLYGTPDCDNFKDSLCALSVCIQAVLNKCYQRTEQIRKTGEQGQVEGERGAGFSGRLVRDSVEGWGGGTYLL